MKVKKLILLFVTAFSLVYCADENDVTGYIESGNLEEIKKLLAKDLDPTDTIGSHTYFQYAVVEGQFEILKAFFAHSGSRLEEYKLKDLLFFSVKENQLEIYQYLSKEVDLGTDQTSISHLINLLDEAEWQQQIADLMLTNKDVNVFYDFFEKNQENEELDTLMEALFKKQFPINETYIGSKYDGYIEEGEHEEYAEGEEYQEYEEYEEPGRDYAFGSFVSLMNKINERKDALMIENISTNTDNKKTLLSFGENENKLFNNFYNRVFNDNSFDEYFDYEDLRRRYTGTVSTRLPYYLPKYSRFNHEYYIDEEKLNNQHNSNKQFFAYLLHRLDRNPFILRWIWAAWKETIFSNISTKTYFKKTFYDYTDALIRTYDTITSRDNYKEALEQAYHNLATNKSDYIDECIPEGIQYYEDGWRIDWTWAPSFWARRFYEGNQEVVYKILKEISAHYDGDELNKLIKKRLDKEISEARYLSDFKRLVAEGADAKFLVGKEGISKLHVAVLKNNLLEIKKLINGGTDVNTRDDKKYTPLYYATKVETAKLLVENGALINDSIMKKKPIKYFRDRKENDIADFLENYQK